MTVVWSDELVEIHHADALDLPLPDESVDLVVTSPPYFGLRSYTDAGEHYSGQIGSEATPAEFLDALLEATREMVRVLKPTGSIWVNLGDKYAADMRGPDGSSSALTNGAQYRAARNDSGARRPTYGVPKKSLLGMPWRYAIRCIDELGLILRAEVIWAKPNGLPESVTDRVRRSHEQWFHFTRSQRYFASVDEVREPHSPDTHPGRTRSVGSHSGNGVAHRTFAGNTDAYNPLGKLPGSVWEIPTQPLRVPEELGVDHFAAFPMEWPRRIIAGWAPTGYCTDCGEPRRPVATSEQHAYRTAPSTGRPKRQDLSGTRPANGWNGSGYPQTRLVRTIVGEACGCPDPTAPTTPAVVLDPFGGTGTTALAARALGRRAIHVDLSRDYCRLDEWRLTDPGEAARALGVDKPPAVPAGQSDLLTLLDTDGGAA